MKKLKQIIPIAFLLVFVISGISNGQANKPWEIPAKFKSMNNPVKSDDASIKAGQALYTKNCAACHGKTGLGDGPKSKALKTPVPSFLNAEFTKQSDGDMFYKSKIGRGEMPKYEGKIDDDGIWQLVNYMRTLKK